MKILDALTDSISKDLQAISGIFQPFTRPADGKLTVDPEPDRSIDDDHVGEISPPKPYTVTQFFQALGLPDSISEAADEFIRQHATNYSPTLWQLFKAGEYGIHEESSDSTRRVKISHTRSIEDLVMNPELAFAQADKDWNMTCDASTGAMGIRDGQVDIDPDSPLQMLDDDAQALADKQQDIREAQQSLKELVDEVAGDEDDSETPPGATISSSDD